MRDYILPPSSIWRRDLPPAAVHCSRAATRCAYTTKIVQRWSKLWANVRALSNGDFHAKCWAKLAIWADPVQVSFDADEGGVVITLRPVDGSRWPSFTALPSARCGGAAPAGSSCRGNPTASRSPRRCCRRCSSSRATPRTCSGSGARWTRAAPSIPHSALSSAVIHRGYTCIK